VIVYFEDNFFGNFINIIKRMIYTPEEKIFMYNKYLVLRSTTLVQRAWRTKYKSKTAPNRSTISSVVNLFKKTGSVVKLNRKTRNNSQKRKDAQTVLKKVIAEKPSLSLRKASQVAKISHSLARLILKDDLGLKPYKLPDLHEIEAADYQKRLDFCSWIKGLPNNAIEWFIFSDESYFELTPSANKQNNRLWLKTRPTEGIENPLYDKKVLVFCAMSSKRIYGPYFFESTVNEDKYHKMLVHFFWPKIVREDFRKYYFQQDGASPHRGKKVQKYLLSKFKEKFIDKKK
jgi:hypothetical protein